MNEYLFNTIVDRAIQVQQAMINYKIEYNKLEELRIQMLNAREDIPVITEKGVGLGKLGKNASQLQRNYIEKANNLALPLLKGRCKFSWNVYEDELKQAVKKSYCLNKDFDINKTFICAEKQPNFKLAITKLLMDSFTLEPKFKATLLEIPHFDSDAYNYLIHQNVQQGNFRQALVVLKDHIQATPWVTHYGGGVKINDKTYPHGIAKMLEKINHALKKKENYQEAFSEIKIIAKQKHAVQSQCYHQLFKPKRDTMTQDFYDAIKKLNFSPAESFILKC